MIHMHEVNNYNIAIIDPEDHDEIEVENIDWASVKEGDVIITESGTKLGTVDSINENYITVSNEED